MRRARGDQLVDRTDPPDLEFLNAAQFDSIENATPLILFYKESATDDQPIFDVKNDRILYRAHEDPFVEHSLAEYEACVTRAHYECRLHPNQSDALDLVRSTLPTLDESTLVFVYKRDSAQASLVQNRRANPFQNPVNGIRNSQASDELILFAQHSFEPFLRATIIWQSEARINATVGLFAVSVIEQLV